jgi:hypothetical protein
MVERNRAGQFRLNRFPWDVHTTGDPDGIVRIQSYLWGGVVGMRPGGTFRVGQVLEVVANSVRAGTNLPVRPFCPTW